MMVNGLWKVFYIIKHSVFIISLLRKSILRNRVCSETQSQTTLQKETGQWWLYVFILGLYHRRKKEKHHVPIRESSDFVLLKPASISVDIVLGKSGSLFMWETCRRWPQTQSTEVVLYFWRKRKCCSLFWMLVEVKGVLCFSVFKSECESEGATVLPITFFKER